MASEKRFGFEWNKYSDINPDYETQLLNWIYPLKKEDFKDKAVLDAGCGMGRNSFWVLLWGAARVVAFDNDARSVEAAKNNLKNFNNAAVFLKSVYDIGFQDEFDIVFSIGVIHHLKDPKTAIKNLVKALKPEGKLLLWVYSYEGNERLVRLLNPLRKNITSKLPVQVVHFLSYFLSAPLWLFLRVVKFKNLYLRQLQSFKFWHIHSIVFDQLIPEVAVYYKKEELENLVKHRGLREIKIFRPPNSQGLIVIGVK